MVLKNENIMLSLTMQQYL